MSRRLWLGGVGGAAVLSALIGVFFGFRVHETQSNTTTSSAATSPASPTHPATAATSAVISPGNVHLIEQALDSSDRQMQATALAVELRSVYLQSTQSMLPAGATLTIEPKTFQTSGDTAVVDAQTSIGKTFALRLVRENDSWLILYTVEES